MSIDLAIRELEGRMRHYQIEFNRFLAGDRPVPPLDLQDEIGRMIRALQGQQLQRAVDRFRLSGIEAKFNSFRDLNGRRLRQVEEGSGARRPSADEPAFDPERGVVVGTESSRGAVVALYKGLYAQSTTPPRVDLESFHAYISKQVGAIRQKTGCAEVQFRVASEDGKLKLKARPVAKPS